jgi:superfamily I DNA/RNA helicase
MNENKSKFNPQQKKAITFGNGPLLIIAGAGTGKTMRFWL